MYSATPQMQSDQLLIYNEIWLWYMANKEKALIKVLIQDRCIRNLMLSLSYGIMTRDDKHDYNNRKSYIK